MSGSQVGQVYYYDQNLPHLLLVEVPGFVA